MSIVLKEKKLYKIFFVAICLILLLAGLLLASEDAYADITTDPPENYLTFSGSGAFTLSAMKKWNGTLYYSTPGGSWTTWNGEKITATVSQAGTYDIYLCGLGNTIITGSYDYQMWKISGNHVDCTGNIETLLDYSVVDAGGEPTMGARCFYYMFYYCGNLTHAPDLPAMTLSEYCYSNMFCGCENLVEVPAILPATTLSKFCYQNMFAACASLTYAPVLPATILAEGCYEGMFSLCIKLQEPPELPATTLAKKCYSYMFSECLWLSEIPDLPATTLADGCYEGMFIYALSFYEESGPGHRKEILIRDDSGQAVNPVLNMFGEEEDLQVTLGVPIYTYSAEYNATLASPVANGTITADNIKNGKCESSVTITFTLNANEGYPVVILYYTEDDDSENEKHYITPVEGQYKLKMPKKNITIVCKFDRLFAEINGESYCESDIKEGVEFAVEHGYVVNLLIDLSETDVTIDDGKILYINFNGHSWGTVVTLDTVNVVGINAPGQDSNLHSSIENIRAANNINHVSTENPSRAAQYWLDLDGDGYVNESDVSVLREKFESAGITV